MKVFKVLENHCFVRREQECHISGMIERHMLTKKHQVFQELAFYLKKRHMKRLQHQHATDYSRKRTLDRVFVTLRVLVLKGVNEKLLKSKADDFHALTSIKAGFSKLNAYVNQRKAKKIIKERAADHFEIRQQ
jgi:hypothetical protein